MTTILGRHGDWLVALRLKTYDASGSLRGTVRVEKTGANVVDSLSVPYFVYEVTCVCGRVTELHVRSDKPNIHTLAVDGVCDDCESLLTGDA